MIKTVIFDFGNVLVTFDRVFCKVSNDFNIDFEEFIKYYSSFEEAMTIGKIKTDFFWRECIRHFNLDLHKAKKYDFARAWVSDYEIIGPINELVYELSKDLNIGILSNINSEIWEAAQRDAWVPKINYKSVILSYKLGFKKPEREIYEVSQKEAGVKPEEILFVDDKEENLVEPRNMGWVTILFDPNKAKEGVEKIRSFF